jgi:hypothetical protein
MSAANSSRATLWEMGELSRARHNCPMERATTLSKTEPQGSEQVTPPDEPRNGVASASASKKAIRILAEYDRPADIAVALVSWLGGVRQARDLLAQVLTELDNFEE